MEVEQLVRIRLVLRQCLNKSRSRAYEYISQRNTRTRSDHSEYEWLQIQLHPLQTV